MSGYFITFEGGDGSGKSTHARLVAQRLEKEGHDVLQTREPGDTPAGKIIREIIIEHTLEPRAELLLFLADRAEHVEKVIRPALEAGKIVICDRFSGSTFAYQLAARGAANTADVLRMDEFARGGITPALTVYLDADPEITIQRRKDDPTQETNRFDEEALVFHRRVRESFLEQADQTGWVKIVTEGDMDDNHDKVYAAVKAFLG